MSDVQREDAVWPEFVHPLEFLKVDATFCGQCSWRVERDDVAAWRSHQAERHPERYERLIAALSAIADTGSYDTFYEAAALRLVGKILDALDEVSGRQLQPGDDGA